MPTTFQYAPARSSIRLGKRADSGSEGNESSFEASFAALANSYLTEAAPSLLQYEVGFQLVSRDVDNNKAVGVYGFKVGPTWLFAPVFFVDSDLKGHELLYIKGQDQFVPLEEGWISDLLARKPADLGRGVDRSGRRLGVRYPDLQRALEGPRKYAALSTVDRAAIAVEAAEVMSKAGAAAAPLRGLPDWAKVGVACLAGAAARADGPAPSRLLDLIAEGGIKLAATLAARLDDHPRLRAGFDAFYAAEDVAAAIRTAKRASTRPVSRPAAVPRVDPFGDEAVRAKVAVHRFDGPWSPASPLLDDDDREALVRDGLLIKDARADDEVSKAYAVDVKVDFPTLYSTPDETGLYDVLTKDGDTEECLVLIAPLGPSGPAPWATVVRMESGRRAFLNVHPGRVWAVRRDSSAAGNGAGPKGQDGSGWFDGLPDGPKSIADDAYYIAVGPYGQATLPFRVVDDRGEDAGGGRAYEVYFDDHARQGRSPSTEAAGSSWAAYPRYSGCNWDGYRIHLGQETGTRLRAHGGDVYVPAGFKLLRLAPDDGEAGKGDGDGPMTMSGMSAGAEPLRLGDSLSVADGVNRKTAALSVAVDGLIAVVDGRRMAVKAALEHLVTGVGLREAAARAVLDAGGASWRRHRKAAGFRVKRADPYQGDPYLTYGGPYAPGVLDPPAAPDGTFGGRVSAYGPFEQAYPVPELAPVPGNHDYYEGDVSPDPRAVQVAQDASEGGQREVFDTAMIGSLLKTTSDDGLVDRYMKDLMKALDRLGRLLFNFHWHRDRFADRYGEDELPELEDSIRNSFDGLGELVLYLRRRTVVASPDEAARSIDLDESSD